MKMNELEIRTDNYSRYHGDCLEVMKEIPSKSVDMVLCDLPYGATQKPVDLCEYLIKTYTNEGDLVLDNCMGSGSTGVATLNTNRKFIGIELDENYFNIAKKRLEEVDRLLF